MAKRGHNLTVFSPDFDKNPPPDVHYVVTENTYKSQREMVKEIMGSADIINQFAKQPLYLLDYYVEICQSI